MAIPLVLYSWSPAVEQRRKRCRQSTPTPRYNHYWHTLYTFETFFLLLSPKDQRDLKLEFSIFIPLVTKSDGPTLVINCSEKSLGIESLNFYSYPFYPDGPQRPGIRAAAVRGRPGTVSGASPIPAISGNSHSSHPSLSTMSNVDRLQWQVG